MFDTLSDLIQYLNLVKNLYFQFKEKSADSIKKIMQFNIKGIIDTGQWKKWPKIAQKVSKIDKKSGDFSSKMANIGS